MLVPSELQLSKSDVGSLIAIGIYIFTIGVMWNAPVLKSILYPFKVCADFPSIVPFSIQDSVSSVLYECSTHQRRC